MTGRTNQSDWETAIKRYLWGICLLLAAVPALAEVPLKDFARDDGFDQAQISPDGAYVALRIRYGSQAGLVVVDVAQHKIVGNFGLGQDRTVYQYAWAGPKRLVVSLAQSFGPSENPWLTGELLGIDATGTNSRYLFGARGGQETGSHIDKGGRDNGVAFIVRELPADSGHVIVKIENWDNELDSNRSTACRMDTQNGSRDNCVVAPVTGTRMDFGIDDSGFVRYAVGSDLHNLSVSYARSPDHLEWRPLGTAGNASVDGIEGFSNDGRFAYLSTRENGGKLCLVRQDLGSGQRDKLACDTTADLERTVFSFDGNEPVAAVFESGIPSVQLLDTQNPARLVVKQLQDAFPGQIALPVSQTRDGSKAVVLVYSDRNPGDFYLFDTKTLHADYLIAANDWIDPRQMAERKPIHYAARDGQTIYGYFTVPPGRELRDLPLVVMPHGGPFNIRDHWGWDADAQALASRGYAVLQVNFRGSGGFGSGFVRQARQNWDRLMIDDITDGTHWAVAQGYADPRRLCIFGISYGGYAALMSAEREPDLYRCAIGVSGVYDLVKLKQTWDGSDTKQAQNYVADFIGANDERLRAASPLTYVDKLKAALMIAHGKGDERAPFSQAEELRDALEQRHYPYEWLVKGDEDHGFYRPQNRVELYQRVITFLDRNIGPNAEQAPTTVQAQTSPADEATAAKGPP